MNGFSQLINCFWLYILVGLIEQIETEKITLNSVQYENNIFLWMICLHFFAHVSFINEAQWLFYGWMYINDNIRSFLNSSF